MQEDITELAKRVLEAQEVYQRLGVKPDEPTHPFYEAAPKLAQAVLDLIVMLDSANKTTQLHSDVAEHAVNRALKAEEEIAALRPDALAWREREARIESERAELRERMGK